MGDKSVEKLPEYDHPPLTEVVCSVLFQPLEKFAAPYLGLLWQEIRDDFPTTEEALPVMALIETAAGTVNPDADSPDFNPFLPRTWFVHRDKTAIIQLQRDRFIYNWRKLSDADEYPRYNTIISKFAQYYDQYLEFLNDHELGVITPLQFELTYVNHIKQGQGWQSLEEIGNAVPHFSWSRQVSGFLPSPDMVNLRSSFPLPDNQGRLHVSVRTTNRSDTQEKVVILDLTARGMAENTSQEAMYKWFDQAREWIVKGFSELTSAEIQQNEWGKR